MPGTVYDREYKVCSKLVAQLYLDTFDVIDLIPVSQLFFVDQLPVCAGWYTSRVLAEINENGVYALYHPQQDGVLLADEQIHLFDSFGSVGMHVFNMRFPLELRYVDKHRKNPLNHDVYTIIRVTPPVLKM